MSKPRIQDDLYTYVNQEKLDELIIPDDKPCAGGFQTLAEDVEKIFGKRPWASRSEEIFGTQEQEKKEENKEENTETTNNL